MNNGQRILYTVEGITNQMLTMGTEISTGIQAPPTSPRNDVYKKRKYAGDEQRDVNKHARTGGWSGLYVSSTAQTI